jgi:hypothetical protein
VFDQRAASGAMQHLGKLGTHPRPLTCGKNHYRSVGMVWHRPLLWRGTTAFGNDEGGERCETFAVAVQSRNLDSQPTKKPEQEKVPMCQRVLLALNARW